MSTAAKLADNLSTKETYVLGIDYQVRSVVPWQDAVTHILQGVMTPFLVHPTKRVRNADGSIDIAHPLIVKMNYWATPPKAKKHNLDDRASRRDILLRDGRTCCYCGGVATTVDHIIPESVCKRKGYAHDGWTWLNLVACCTQHNSEKADRTPEEAGMTLLWDPHTGGDSFGRIQSKIWKVLEEGGGYYPEFVGVEGVLAKQRR